MKDNDGDDKHEIDNFYVNFPSSQKNTQVIIEQLKDEDDKEKYSPKTEDITDDEEDTKDKKHLQDEHTSKVETDKVEVDKNQKEIHKKSWIMKQNWRVMKKK